MASEEAMESLLYDLVALARGFLESATILDDNTPIEVANELRALQLTRSDRHARASDAEHHGEKLVREAELVGVCAIVRHEEPPRTALHGFVAPVARHGLRRLLEQGVGVAQREESQRGVVVDDLAEHPRTDAQRLARNLG